MAQTAQQAIETLRRSKGMDAVLMFAEEGPVFAAWHRDAAEGREKARFRRWLEEWQAETRETAAALQS
jgi:carbamoyltransferase